METMSTSASDANLLKAGSGAQYNFHRSDLAVPVETATLYLPIVGEGIPGSVRFEPSSIDFGLLLTSNTKDQTVVLVNESDADVEYKLIVKAKAIKEQKKYSDNYGSAYYTTFELPTSATENGKVIFFFFWPVRVCT
jgi:hypothetical protein